ncbi:MAG: GYD domain-containing protein [Planctomycetales bacterium]|nr:GYD domain-containing protein [Planctomycetales bacterium]
MVRYISIINFTVQGIQGIKNSPSRAHAFAAQIEQLGGKVLFQYWSLGDADGCFGFEVPSEQVATQLLLRLEQQGNVRTKSLRVFDASEFASIVDGL